MKKLFAAATCSAIIAQTGFAQDCDCEAEPAIDCLNVSLTRNSVEVGNRRLMPAAVTRGSTEFWAVPVTNGALVLDRAFDLSDDDRLTTFYKTRESSVLFGAKNPETVITIDWVPNGGGPLKIYGFNDGKQELIQSFPFPIDADSILRTDQISVAGDRNFDGFLIWPEAESGFVRVCVSTSAELDPPPIETVLEKNSTVEINLPTGVSPEIFQGAVPEQ